MASSYRRRYYRRRKSNGGDGVVGLVIFLALVAYAYHIDLNSALNYVLLILIAVAAIVLAVMAWRWWRARQHHLLITNLEQEVDGMTGLEFEKFVADLLRRQGYTRVKITETYDLGIDIIAYKDGIKWGVQAKRYSGMVKAAAVRQVVTALKYEKYKCDRAMVVTNNYYSRPAKELAKSNDCVLVDRDILATWVT